MPIESAFELLLPHGVCTGVRIGPDLDLAGATDELFADERAHAATLGPKRRTTWVLGRIALRRSLRALGATPFAIGVTDRGAPALAAGWTGSISHKDDIVVALADRDERGPVGVDVEWDRAPRHDVRRHVLREDEGVDLAAPWEQTATETILRFSAKEAIYKALDRHVGRYVGFHEVAVLPRADSSADAVLHLREREGPFDVEVHWRRLDGVVLTSARVARRSSGGG